MRVGKLNVFSSHDNVATPDSANFYMVYLYSPDGKAYKKSSQGLVSLLFAGDAIKEYVAVLNDNGAAAPSVQHLIKNDFVSPVSFTYLGPGAYTINCDEFTENKGLTYFQLDGSGEGTDNITTYIDGIHENSARFSVFVGGDYLNGFIAGAQIRIQIYP